VCTGHCTVQCPVHRQPHASNLFSCALSGGSPDSYCALSGVHRIGTVDCPVRPYSIFKKLFLCSRPRPATSSLSLASLCLSGDFLSLAGAVLSPVTTVLRRPSAPSPALARSAAPFSLCFLCLSVPLSSAPLLSTPQVPYSFFLSNSVNPCGEKCCSVSLECSCRFLAP
jgi:hypothetical protein